MATKQAEYRRKWDLAGLALAYLKLRHLADDAAHREIAAWFLEIARRADAFQTAPGRTPNNHLHWLGLALGATALATDDAAIWRRAETIMGKALDQIGDDGMLPLELARGSRALHYHTLSAMALVTLAELGFARGVDWYRSHDGALHRLVAATTAGLAAPEIFDRAAGQRQVRPVKPRNGWLFLYQTRLHRSEGRKERLPRAWTSMRRHRLLGGDVRVLLAALDRRKG